MRVWGVLLTRFNRILSKHRARHTRDKAQGQGLVYKRAQKRLSGLVKETVFVNPQQMPGEDTLKAHSGSSLALE